eukprot:Blabericola_migrator_1__3168@NODE_1926_length_3552_cov_105_965280_g1232_i0_p1_GENE_NODE_1926_length_3552_cov_105_965280_g1232_i0NODE_1926_length_3552_cov_105_965280_g1232_i0_p1_ORF_typecomplete_len595_score45_52BBL5/PF07289_11/0_067BBL5/PF07289_11/9_3e07zfC3HC4_3/PF13920_6/7_6e03zfC3HC4_3/PF13920_6/1_9e06Vps36_ESCRTII/PF11605_8/0_06Vps36_ESCRTII/PF11605_8/10ProkRING_4/PF14447_6/0_081zfRING_6/PF14835_6/1_6_NODE_1926_length_3552_cov_105_965280_g1232_i0931877
MGACNTKLSNKVQASSSSAEDNEDGSVDVVLYTNDTCNAVAVIADGYHYDIRNPSVSRQLKRGPSSARRASLGTLRAVPYASTMMLSPEDQQKECVQTALSSHPHIDLFRRFVYGAMQERCPMSLTVLRQERTVAWDVPDLESSFLHGETIQSSWGGIRSVSNGCGSDTPNSEMGTFILTTLRLLWFSGLQPWEMQPQSRDTSTTSAAGDFTSSESVNDSGPSPLSPKASVTKRNVAIGWRAIQQISLVAPASQHQNRALTITCQRGLNRLAFTFSVPAVFWKHFVLSISAHRKWFRATSMYRDIVTQDPRLVCLSGIEETNGIEPCSYYGEMAIAQWNDMLVFQRSRDLIPFTVLLTSARLVATSHRNPAKRNLSIPLYTLGPVKVGELRGSKFILLNVCGPVKVTKLAIRPRTEGPWHTCNQRAFYIELSRLRAVDKVMLGPSFNAAHLIDGEMPSLAPCPSLKRKKRALEVFHDTRASKKSGLLSDPLKSSVMQSLALASPISPAYIGDCHDLDLMVPGNISPLIGTPKVQDTPYAANICVICETYPIEIIFGSCEHLSCCGSCGEILTACPICHTHIQERIPIANFISTA